MSFLHTLPLAIVMIAGPQVLSAVFFATSESWRANSLAYVAGAAISLTIVVTAAFLLGAGAGDEGASNDTLYWIVLALLVYAAIHTYLKRNEAEPPKWMGRLQSADASFAFKLGFLLLGFFPSDLVTSISVGSYVAAQDDTWVHVLPFVGLTLIFLALPALAVEVMGSRAEKTLPRVRDWMNANSWIVNEIVLAFFALLVLSNLV